ncbi:MAG: beta-lactamase family protein [Ilumatobacteraceae bacterium]|nr:beta-lactamase family protein [Ilumatobacteraceae bacterium]
MRVANRPELQRLLDELFARPADQGTSLAAVVVHEGHVVAERYGHQPDTMFGPGGPVTPDTPLVSWSTAKSITHAAVGIAVGDGLLDPEAPAAVPAWRGTEKEAITLLDLLEMRPGLRFVEDYVDGDVSHCIAMLFGEGAGDHAAYAAALPLDHPPGTVWNYSSGTTNIVCRILGDAIGGGESGMRAFLRDRLLGPAGMHSADPRFDAAGTWVGSSYVYATARDFARFGELALHDGVVDGVRVLPEGWVDHARTFVAHDDAEGVPGGFDYGRHWWMWPDFDRSLAAHGYEGQYVVVLPDRELVMVHLGKTPAEQRHHVVAALRAVAETV